MARKKSKRTRKAPQQKQQPTTRRDVLRFAGYGAFGLTILGIGGLAAARSFSKYTAEHDLAVIGQGAPVIVQVHDPQCPSCAKLQKQTRKALKVLGDDAPVYRVANIRTPQGQDFQTQHTVPHVTLILFDAQGRRVGDVRGITPADQLVDIFRSRMGL